ncbi:MAG: DNA-directed RNA polymerase subunit delta [Bacillales bacterium]
MEKNYKDISIINIAFDIIKECKEPISFKELYSKVCELSEMSKEQISEQIASFYFDLSSDGRFIGLTNNYWDLRERQNYDKVNKVDMNSIYVDIDNESLANTDADEMDDIEIEEYGVEKDDEEDNEDI